MPSGSWAGAHNWPRAQSFVSRCEGPAPCRTALASGEQAGYALTSGHYGPTKLPDFFDGTEPLARACAGARLSRCGFDPRARPR